jgi:hypothetical protein
MKRGTITFLKVNVFITGIIILALCLFWLPGLAKDSAEMNPEFAHLRFPVLVGLYFTAIPFFLALYQGFKLLIFIGSENAFSGLAVKSLGYIKNCAITIIILYLIGIVLLLSKSALHPGIAIIGFVIIFATLVISLFSAVLQQLLRSALKIKSENELTV